MPDRPKRTPTARSRRRVAIDFEKAFLKGARSYDTAVGDWWEGRASNPSHRRAYSDTAAYLRAQFRAQPRAARKPRFLVDYACGSGHFLAAMAAAFPDARIVALDGSEKMLRRARARLQKAGHEADFVTAPRSFDLAGPRIRLVKTRLPNFSLPAGQADAAVFLFPNLTCAPNDQDYYDRHGYKNPADRRAARALSRLKEADPDDEVSTAPPGEIFDGLMTERVIARHIRALLKPGGMWLKADYANARRENLSRITQVRTLFSEGALREPAGHPACGPLLRGADAPAAFFRYLRHRFRLSPVIMDVFQQTLDPTDKTGGYFVSVFEAR